MSRTYTVRNDYVVIRVTLTGHVGKIAVGDTAEEGKVYTVVGAGPEVKGLMPGDRVTLFSEITKPISICGIPGEKDLVIIQQANVSSVIKEVNEVVYDNHHVFEIESFCDHCDKDTPHTVVTTGHERDSSQDTETCNECKWWSMGLAGKQYPPLEV